jgi:hypothetical protein
MSSTISDLYHLISAVRGMKILRRQLYNLYNSNCAIICEFKINLHIANTLWYYMLWKMLTSCPSS